MKFFIHEYSDIKTNKIGQGTTIWQYSVVLAGAQIGKNCNICSSVFIESDVVIGDNVTIKNGVQIWDGLTVEDNVFIGPNVTFSNDIFPRSKVYPDKFLRTLIKKGASVGANATILPGLTIGENSMVGAGAVVTRSVPSNAKVIGNPAKIVGYVDAPSNNYKIFDADGADKTVDFSIEKTAVNGVTLHHFPIVNDIRGELVFGEFEKTVPFLSKRFFLITNVPSLQIRGEHAHLNCHQFLICTKGSCSVVFDDGKNREEVILDKPNKGIYLPPMTWAVQYKYTPDAVLLVFASDYYDHADYIRDYDKFLALVNHEK